MSALSCQAPDCEPAAYPRWVRSSYSSTGTNNCVEAARLGAGRFAVRDSKNTDGPALLFSTAAWASFLGTVCDGGLGGRHSGPSE